MKCDHYFYQCSREYINSIDDDLYDEIVGVISKLPKRRIQQEVNNDLFWLLTFQGWSYDTLSGTSNSPPNDLDITRVDSSLLKKSNNRDLCLTSESLGATWHADFGKQFGHKLVQIEAQFGKVESMFKDFCGFRIARAEGRLALGIEIVMSNPGKYFFHRKKSISEMAYFEIARKTLPAIGIECPIWVVGIKEERQMLKTKT